MDNEITIHKGGNFTAPLHTYRLIPYHLPFSSFLRISPTIAMPCATTAPNMSSHIMRWIQNSLPLQQENIFLHQEKTLILLKSYSEQSSNMHYSRSCSAPTRQVSSSTNDECSSLFPIQIPKWQIV